MFKSAQRYGDRLNSFDAVKLLALFTMVIDHIGDYLLPENMWLRVIGRIAFPLFLFLVGYSGVWKVRAELLGWTILIVVIAIATHHAVFPLNVLASIALTRYCMEFLTRTPLGGGKLLAVFIFCLVAWIPTYYMVDYGAFALMFALCGFMCRRRPQALSTHVALAATLFVHFYVQGTLFRFDHAHFAAAWAMGMLDLIILWRFTLTPLSLYLALPLRRALQWASRNTLPLYGLHVIALLLAERIFFPERVLSFHWI